MSFQIRGLDPEAFQQLFRMSDEALATYGAQRVVADQADAYPCRIALQRVEEGEELLLLNHTHQPVPTSPYRASGPIFVSRSGQCGYFHDALPPIMRDRLLSLRAYDAEAIMIDAEVAEGEDAVIGLIRRFFENQAVASIQAHFAKRGCFAARIERA